MIKRVVITLAASFGYAVILRYLFWCIGETNIKIDPKGAAFALVLAVIVWFISTITTLLASFDKSTHPHN